MNTEIKQKMRDVLLEKFGLDITNADCYFSTQNYAFVIPGEPFMIRVSAAPKKSRSEVMSELIWLDDLKQFEPTICEPSISKAGKILEEFEVEGIPYRASIFRTAKGVVKKPSEMTPSYFVNVGRLLGKIHHVSTNERELGIRFKRKTKAEDLTALKERTLHMVPDPVVRRIEIIEEKVNSLPCEIGKYGICHGDFHMNNFFVDSDKIWIFDFDSCAYANYLYDVASFIQACFLHGFGAGKDLRVVLEKEILPYFKEGYTAIKQCDEHYWDDLELFIAYRTVITYLALCEIDSVGIIKNTDGIKQFIAYIISRDDVLNAMSAAMRSAGDMLQSSKQ